jgi:hypothetical protein
MTASEARFGEWLTRQGCPWVYINQAPGPAADGALRARPRRKLHRPDFLVFMDGIGTIAVDVKDYELRIRRIDYLAASWDRPPESCPVGYVKLVWSEIVALREFQNVSSLPTWLCLFFEHDAGDVGCLYRVDSIYDAYAPLFIAQDRGLRDDQPPAELFDGWPIERAVDPSLPSKEEAFDFLVDHGEINLHEALDCRSFSAVNVPPIVVRLDGEGHITELISFSRPEVAELPPSQSARNYAEDMARALSLKLPSPLDQLSCSNFIERHKPAYAALRR